VGDVLAGTFRESQAGAPLNRVSYQSVRLGALRHAARILWKRWPD